MAFLGTVVVAGVTYTITRLELTGGRLVITADHAGPVPPCQGEPAAVFGADGRGIGQSWRVTIPADAAAAHNVALVLPMQITHLEAADELREVEADLEHLAG